MEEEITVTRRELLELLAQTERRIAQDFDKRLHAVEAQTGQRLHIVEARLEVVEERPLSTRHCWTMPGEPSMQPHLELAARSTGNPAGDVEIKRPKARRLCPEASHLMPHPDNNNYVSLSAREIPPLVENPEGQEESPAKCDENGDSDHKEYKDLPMDCWGSGIICIIEEVPKIFTGTAGYAQFLRTGFVLFCLTVNIILQYLLLWFVMEYVCNPAVSKLQTLYKAYHGECFDTEGTFLDDSWHQFPYRQSLCDMALSEPAFIGTMLILWCVKMLGEARSIIYLVRSIDGIPKVVHPSLMLNYVDTDNGIIHEIVGLTDRVRLGLNLFIIIPKFGINLALTYIGVRWLSSTVSFSDLILNALALGFIVEIDELLLTSLYPERMIKALEHAKFATSRHDLTPEEDDADLVKRYHQAIAAIVVLATFVYTYLMYFQQVLPHFVWDVNAHNCLSVRKERFTPQCKFGAWNYNCFPYGANVTIGFENRIA